MKRKFAPQILGLCVLIVIVVIGAYVWYSESSKKAGPHPEILRDMHAIEAAITRYQTEFGQDPSTDKNGLFDVLSGENTRGLAFLDGERLSGGIDPWGTFYQVYDSMDEWLIRSAGRDKVFNDLSVRGNDDVLLRVEKKGFAIRKDE